MNLEEDIRKKFGEMQDIVVERLHPPMAIVSEKEGDRRVLASTVNVKPANSKTDSKLAIGFNNLDPKYQKWALSLETQRHYYYTKFGKTHRKDTKEVKKDLEEKEIELDAIKVMKKQKTPAFMGVINEFKAKVAKLKEKRVDG